MFTAENLTPLRDALGVQLLEATASFERVQRSESLPAACEQWGDQVLYLAKLIESINGALPKIGNPIFALGWAQRFMQIVNMAPSIVGDDHGKEIQEALVTAGTPATAGATRTKGGAR